MSRAERVGAWSGWVALGWAVAFAYLGLTSAAPVPEAATWDGVDLVGHAAASFLLAVLLSEWLVVRRCVSRSAALVAAGLGTLALGLLIEGLQIARPTRSFELADVAADLLGSGLGPWAWAMATRGSPSVVRSAAVVSVGAIAVAGVVALVAFTA